MQAKLITMRLMASNFEEKGRVEKNVEKVEELFAEKTEGDDSSVRVEIVESEIREKRTGV